MVEIKDEVVYDVRLIERHIRKGLVSRKEYEKRLKEIDDVTDQGEFLSLNQDEEIVVRNGPGPVPGDPNAAANSGVNTGNGGSAT